VTGAKARENVALTPCGPIMNFDRIRYTLRGAFYVWVNRPKQAATAYEAAFRADPAHAESARTLAWLHARDKQWRAAQAWFTRSLEIEPDHADTWFNLGYAQEQDGQYDAAIDSFRKAVELKPTQDRAWYGLGMALAHQGRHREAVDALDKAAALQPMNPHALYALGMAWHHSNEPDRVKAVIERCLSHEPGTAKRLVHDAQRTDLAHLLPP